MTRAFQSKDFWVTDEAKFADTGRFLCIFLFYLPYFNILK